MWCRAPSAHTFFEIPFTESAMSRASALSITAILALASGVSLEAQQPRIDPSAYSTMLWRNVGPFRGGRISATSGVIGQPGVFYVGLPAGGVWKTTSEIGRASCRERVEMWVVGGA